MKDKSARRTLESLIVVVVLCVITMTFTAGTTGESIEVVTHNMTLMNEFQLVSFIAICCLTLAFFMAWFHGKALREQSTELSKAMREGNDVIRDLIAELKQRPCIRKPAND